MVNYIGLCIHYAHNILFLLIAMLINTTRKQQNELLVVKLYQKVST